MKFSDKLIAMNACTEAVEWCGSRGLVKAWRECPRGDWMLWLAGRIDIDRKLLVLATCDCAETALQYVPEGEDRPAKCIQVARNWCEGTASMDDVKAARRDAYAAYAAAAAAAYAYAAAAYAAAYAAAAADADAAAYAAAADAAAYAAADAAADAASANARRKSLKTCANLVRKRIPVSAINAGIDEELAELEAVIEGRELGDLEEELPSMLKDQAN